MSGSSDQRLSIRLSFDGAQEARAQLEQLGQVGDTAMRKLEAGGQAAGRGVASVADAGNVLRAGLGQINGDLANTGRQFEALANSTLALTSALRSGAGLAGSIGLVVTAATAAYAIYENWGRITGAMTGAMDALTGRFRDNSTALEQANTLLNEYNRLTEAAAVRTARLAGEAILARQAQVSLSQEALRAEIQGLSGEIDRRVGLTEGRLQAARRGPGGAALSEESERILQMEIDRTRQRAANNPEVLRLRAEIQQREGALQELERRRQQFAGEYAASQENVGSVLASAPSAEATRAAREARTARAELTEAEREYQRLVQQGVQLAGTAATEQQRYGEQVLALSAALGAARITQEQYNAAVAALDPAARAAREAQEQAARQAEQFARRSRDALAQIGETAMDRIGTGLVNAFTSGGKAALDFQSLMRGVTASIAADLLKLAVVTPITNAVFGTARPTLAGAFGGGAQSSASGGGMLGSLGSLGSFMPSLGGIGAGVSSFMAMPLFGSAAQASATNSALAAMPGGMMGPAAPSSLGLGATTVGSFLGSAAIGAGLGIAGGNFAGGLRGTANPMPGSMIGTGLGMGLGFLAGGPVGMAIGGALGGTAGGLFGPTTKGNASRSGGDVLLGTDANGQLVITGSAGKRWDGGAATAEVQAQLNAINAQIGARGLSFAGAGQAAVGFGQASGSPRELSLTSLVGQLRGGNANQMTAFGTLAGRGGNLEQALQAADFITQIFEPLSKAGEQTDSFTAAMNALAKTYDEAITKARDLGLATETLEAKRSEALAKMRADAQRGFDSAVRGARGESFVDQLMLVRDNFQANAGSYLSAGRDPNVLFAAQVSAIVNSLDVKQLTTAVEALRGVDDVAVLFAETAIKQKEVAEALAKTADNLRAIFNAGGAISGYLDSLNSTSAGGLSPSDQFTNAQSIFGRDLTLARGNDLDALGRITGSAENLLAAGRGMFASGPEFQALQQMVQSTLANLPATQSWEKQTLDTLTRMANEQQAAAAVQSSLAAGANTRLDGVISTGTGTVEQLAQQNSLTSSMVALGELTYSGTNLVVANLQAANAIMADGNRYAAATAYNTMLAVNGGIPISGSTSGGSDGVARLISDLISEVAELRAEMQRMVSAGERTADATEDTAASNSTMARREVIVGRRAA